MELLERILLALPGIPIEYLIIGVALGALALAFFAIYVIHKVVQKAQR